MEEEKIIKLESQERIKEADTDYLIRNGIKKVGHREIYIIEEKDTGIEICGGTATRYYFDDKEPEEPARNQACILIPREFLPNLKEIIDKRIYHEAEKSMGSK